MLDRISPFKAAKAARARGFNLHPISNKLSDAPESALAF